jgi:hypothetical protein
MLFRVLATIVAVMLVPGCGVFSPGKGDRDSERPNRETPEGVVEKLADAYRRRDIDDYVDCLTDSFVFYFIPKDTLDPNVTIPAELYWGRSAEEEAHRNMFAQTDLITLTLTGEGKVRVGLDPERWLLERHFDLHISPSNIYEWAVGRAHFYVERQEDGLYRMYRWDDLEEVGK